MNDVRLQDLLVPKLPHYKGRSNKSLEFHLRARYTILDALNKDRALTFSDLLSKTKMNTRTFQNYLKILIKERAIKKWNFDGIRDVYSYCFVPDYEVIEIYEKNYICGKVSRQLRKSKIRKLRNELFRDKQKSL